MELQKAQHGLSLTSQWFLKIDALTHKHWLIHSTVTGLRGYTEGKQPYQCPVHLHRDTLSLTTFSLREKLRKLRDFFSQQPDSKGVNTDMYVCCIALKISNLKTFFFFFLKLLL